jgi:hypothetical protein
MNMKKIFIITFAVALFAAGIVKTENVIKDKILPAQQKNENNKNDAKEKNMQDQINELKAKVDELDDLKEEVTALKKQTDMLSALKISGFFDVNISNYKNKPNVFSIGEFELDIEHNYDNFQVAAALVFFEGAELTTGFIDYHLFGGRVAPRGRLFQTEGLHAQIGKFDVPFGNDWRYAGAANRLSIKPPLTTEIIMDGGYNDEGIRILLSLVSLNASIYMLKGIEEQYSYGGNSFGGRLGFTPFSNPFALKNRTMPPFEIGVSYIHDIDREGSTAEKVFAGDIESKIGPMILTSEYYYRDKSAGITLYGYHVTGGIDFNYFTPVPLILFGRYEQVISEENALINGHEGIDKNTLTRVSAGININIAQISYLKFEYQNYLKAYQEFKSDQYYSRSLYFIQLVIKF